jgi:hypothetical protein
VAFLKVEAILYSDFLLLEIVVTGKGKIRNCNGL